MQLEHVGHSSSCQTLVLFDFQECQSLDGGCHDTMPFAGVMSGKHRRVNHACCDASFYNFFDQMKMNLLLRVTLLTHVAICDVNLNVWQIPSLLDYKDQPSENSSDEMMSAPRLSIKATTNPMDFLMDTGNPTLNCTLDGVLKISGVQLSPQPISASVDLGVGLGRKHILQMSNWHYSTQHWIFFLFWGVSLLLGYEKNAV